MWSRSRMHRVGENPEEGNAFFSHSGVRKQVARGHQDEGETQSRPDAEGQGSKPFFPVEEQDRAECDE